MSLSIEEQEIERLQSEKSKLHKLIPKMIKEAKSEAIKEFAERLKEKSHPTVFCDNSIQKTRNVYYRIEEIDIDNLVKEMVGDDK